VKDGRQISVDDVRAADILAIRSTTRVNAALLEGSSVKFVGTATIGTDHIDQTYLTGKGITWMFAAGCNANSVSEYVTAALLRLGRRHNFTLEGKTIGIVGVGNVGSHVAKKAAALGLNILLNDPPRQRAQTEGRNSSLDQFVTLNALLEQSDIVTFHVPLTKDGRDPTWHMANSGLLARLRNGCVFINAARGPVNDTDALIAAAESGRIAHTILDTWEGEPSIRQDMLDIADIATPHIAGHSYEGKVMGTVMVYREACKFLGAADTWDYESLLPPPLIPELSVDCTGRQDEDVLNEIVATIYDIEVDDRNLRTGATADMAKHFDALRKNYGVRREFRFTKVTALNAAPALQAKITSLGFQRVAPEQNVTEASDR